MVGLDSLGLVGPRNLHPEQVFWELHEGGWDHPEKPYGRPPSAPPADPGPPHFPLPEAGDAGSDVGPFELPAVMFSQPGVGGQLVCLCVRQALGCAPDSSPEHPPSTRVPAG